VFAQLVSKIFNLGGHPPTLQTDRQTDAHTTCDLKTALCTVVHRMVKSYYGGPIGSHQRSFDFWPTVLSVEPMVQCVVCRLSSVCRLSVVCDVLYCGKTVRPSQKVSEGVNRKPGSKSPFFGSPPYFYFRFRCYSHPDGRFCLIFAHTAQQSILDGRN